MKIECYCDILKEWLNFKPYNKEDLTLFLNNKVESLNGSYLHTGMGSYNPTSWWHPIKIFDIQKIRIEEYSHEETM